jgi:hypothetical protein
MLSSLKRLDLLRETPVQRARGEVLSQNLRPHPATVTRVLGLIALAILVFGMTTGILSVTGVLHLHPAGIALPLFACMATPIIAFVVAYRRSVAFRKLVLSLDLRLVVLFQFVRVAGLVFLVQYNNHMLPAAAAVVPAVLDLMIGYSALVIAFYLLDRRPFPVRIFLAWNVIGIADFIATGAIFFLIRWNVLYPSEPDWAGLRVLTDFPFALIPAFMVPLATIMHVIAILQTRRERWRSVVPLIADEPAEMRSVSINGDLQQSGDSGR